MSTSLSGSFQLTQLSFANAFGMGGIKPNMGGKMLAKPEIDIGLVGRSFISLIWIMFSNV